MKQMKIGICDGEILFAKRLGRMVEEVFHKKKMSCMIQIFNSGEELLTQVHLLEVVFLDLEMPKMDGMEVGRKIKAIHPTCKIILAMRKIERMKETFRIEALWFIEKPFKLREVEEGIDLFLKKQLGMERIQVFSERSKYNILQRDIVYIKAYNGNVEFKCRDALYRKTTSLSEINKVLDERLFFRINKTYIINLAFVSDCTEASIILEDLEIKVARRKVTQFKKTILDYDVQYGRKVNYI